MSPRRARGKATPPAAPVDRESGEVWIDYMTLGELEARRWPDNPKDHDQSGIQGSVTQHGFAAPPMLDEGTGRLVAGHGRLEAVAAIKAAGQDPPEGVKVGAGGEWSIPVVRGKRWRSEEDALAYLLGDNQLTIAGGWNLPSLGAAIQQLQRLKVPTISLGWASAEIAKLVANASKGAPEPPEPAKEVDADAAQAKWQVQVGQLWRIPSLQVKKKEHRLLCGDATRSEDVDRVIGDQTAQMLWTDPPFGVDYSGGMRKRERIKGDGKGIDLEACLRDAFTNAHRYLRESSAIYIVHPPGPPALVFAQQFVAQGWHWHQTLAWAKNNFVLGMSDYRGQYESILYGWKGKNHLWNGGRDKSNLLQVDRPSVSNLHPTQKPIELIAPCIENNTNQGWIVLDLFGGSGSTLVACEMTGRLARLVELDPRYCAVTLQQAEDMGMAPLLADS